MPHYPDEIEYSDKYQDDHYEYRHVLLPKEVYRKITKGKLLSESVMSMFKLGMEKFGCPTVQRMGPL